MRTKRWLVLVCVCCLLAALLPQGGALAAKKNSTKKKDPMKNKETVFLVTSVTSDADGSTDTYTYNEKGLVTEHARTGSGAGTTSWQYDANDNIETEIIRSDFDELTRHYTYTPEGVRLQSVNNIFGNTVIDYTHDEAGRLTQEIWTVNGIAQWMIGSYTYNEAGLLNTYSEAHNDGYENNSTSFVYDQKGNLEQVITEAGTKTYRNVYQKDLLQNRVVNETYTLTFQYREFVADKKLAERIASQQWQLINEDVSRYLL